jgi:hypothetical protein
MVAAAVLAAACGGSARPDTARATDSPRAADSAAPSSDDCVRGEPVPALLPTARPRFERTGRLEAVETARLNDTTDLRIDQGGCAHYGETYTFTIRRARRDTSDAKYWLVRAADYLRALPVVETRRGEIEQIVTALDGAARAPEPYRYGEAIRASEMALVMVTVRRGREGAVVVEVVFDVAL